MGRKPAPNPLARRRMVRLAEQQDRYLVKAANRAGVNPGAYLRGLLGLWLLEHDLQMEGRAYAALVFAADERSARALMAEHQRDEIWKNRSETTCKLVAPVPERVALVAYASEL